MKKCLLTLICLILGMGYIIAQNKSNKGTEFWVGYGRNNLFNSTTAHEMVLYLSAEQAATVTIRINGAVWNTYTVPANTVIQTATIPKTGTFDCRLIAEGLSSKGIHIESDVPIVAYSHEYGATSSGATMLMPVETYGYTYYSVNYTQTSNAPTCYSWFYIIASEDNTRVQITPSKLTEGGIGAGSTISVNMSKGQIYNVLGKLLTSTASSSTGEDLTGSKVVSVAGSDGNCHPIGVFSGSSRMIIGSSSGDIMQQQVFPASAWGTRYLTYCTVVATSPNQTNLNFFRVAVRDPTTVVKRNGIVLTGLVNNFYYEFSSSSGDYIEADKPILVSQYMPSNGIAGYNDGNGQFGDPEMFYLSPIEQAIKKATFYNTTNQLINNNFVSIIVPNVGFNSLTIDGSNAFDYIGPHPRNNGYRVVTKRWTTGGQHTIQCDSTFTAITYGMGANESYGYNAGTLINNLNNIGGVLNSYGGSFAATTCPNTPFRFSMQAAYKPTKMIWQLSQIASLLPVNIDTTINNPVPIDSSTINGRKYYTYSLPREYYIPSTGSYNLPVTCTAPEIDNCNNTETITTTITVNPGPKGDFTWAYSGCVSDTAYFTGINLPSSYNIIKYRWFYDDNTQDSVLNPKKKFNSQGGHPTKFRVIASNGCIGDTIKTVTTTPSPIATFGMNPPLGCGSATVNFTDTSSFAGSPLTDWYWDFGNGNTLHANSNAAQTQNYPSPGAYIIKHVAGVTGGCGSDTAYKTLNIYAKPIADFTYNTGCLQDSTLQLTNASTVADGQALTWSWNFGEPSSGADNTSTLLNPTHKYHSYNTFPITLVATTVNGCPATITKNYTVTGFSSAIAYDIANENSLCSNTQVKLTNQINIVQDSAYKIEIYWDFANQPTVFNTDNTPTQNEVYNHSYPVFTTPATKTYTIKWVVYSKGGCVSEKTKTITLNAMPTLTFATLIGKCVNTDPISIANANISNALSGNGAYSGNGTDAAGLFTPAIAGVGQHPIKYIYTTSGGCIDSITSNIRVFPKPVAGFSYNNNICLKDSILLTDTSKISTGNIPTRNWDFGDAGNVVKNDATPFYHAYSAFGNYQIKLYVISDSSCVSDTAKQTVTVYPLPQVAFTLPTGVCMPTGEAIFTNQSTITNGTGSQLSYIWDFGDGSATSSTPEPTHYYTAAGSYNVFLTAVSAQGCIDTLTKNLSAFYQKPIAAFTIVGDTLCPNYQLTFTDNSTAPSSTVSSWQWFFGDGDSSVVGSPVHSYAIPGNYTIELTVKNPDGCTSEKITKPIIIYKQPVVDAGPNFLVRAGTPVTLQATSSDTIFHYLWTPSIYLNDDTLLRPTSTPTFNTTYKLMAYGAGGNCVAYDSVKVTALQFLNVANAFSPNGDGINDVWDIPYLSDYPEAKVEIFNRMGQLVFSNIAYAKSWDGKLNGKPLPVGTYYYIIEPKNNGYSKLSGSVTIIK